LLNDGRTATVVSNNKNVLRPLIRIDNSDGTAAEIDLYNDFEHLSLAITKNIRE